MALSPLQQLQRVAGNNICADCQKSNPNWASINIGVMVCLECSGIHRALGTHISKVRSLELDVNCWEGDLLEFMCSVGNTAANEYWEYDVPPEFIRPQEYPELSFIRENYIRAKYERKEFVCRSESGAPLPPPGSDRDGESKSSASDHPRSQRRGVSSNIRNRKEGFLTKSDPRGKSWNRRWFALSGPSLLYFRSQSNSYPAGSIPLPGARTVITQIERHPWCISIETSERNYLIEAQDCAEMLDWAHAIRRSSLHFADMPATEIPEIGSQRSSEAASIIKEGFLSKRGGKIGTWKKRWIRLTNTSIQYLKNQEDPEPAGIIELANATVSDGSAKIGKNNTFCVATPNRFFYFTANNISEMHEWMNAISEMIDSLDLEANSIREQEDSDEEIVKCDD